MKVLHLLIEVRHWQFVFFKHFQEIIKMPVPKPKSDCHLLFFTFFSFRFIALDGLDRYVQN